MTYGIKSYEADRFVPLIKVEIPEGRQMIVTVLVESPGEARFRQREAMARFWEAVCASGPLPPEFDEIMKERVNISREIR